MDLNVPSTTQGHLGTDEKGGRLKPEGGGRTETMRVVRVTAERQGGGESHVGFTVNVHPSGKLKWNRKACGV